MASGGLCSDRCNVGLVVAARTPRTLSTPPQKTYPGAVHGENRVMTVSHRILMVFFFFFLLDGGRCTYTVLRHSVQSCREAI